MKKYVKSKVYIILDGRIIGVLREQKIYLITENRGVLRDGRPVEFRDGKWVYVAR